MHDGVPPHSDQLTLPPPHPSQHTNGVYEGVAIGGDRYPGTTFWDHIIRYEANPNIKMMVLLGEVGGTEEYLICDAIKDGRITKPLVAWCVEIVRSRRDRSPRSLIEVCRTSYLGTHLGAISGASGRARRRSITRSPSATPARRPIRSSKPPTPRTLRSRRRACFHSFIRMCQRPIPL